MADESVRYELDGHVATITYNRPDALNAINGDMREGLNAAFDRFRTEEDAWVAIVTGAGTRVLCGRRHARRRGLGRRVRRHVLGEADHQLVRERLGDLQARDRGGQRLLPRLRAHARDVVRLRDRDPSAPSSAFPKSASACRRSSARSGSRSASTGSTRWSCCSPANASTPTRAKEIGLAGWVVPHDELMNEARGARRSPRARRAARGPRDEGGRRARRSTSRRVEAIRFGETMRRVAGATDDAAEGGRAFRERRPPKWTAT